MYELSELSIDCIKACGISECMMSSPMVRAREHMILTAVSEAMGLNVE